MKEIDYKLRECPFCGSKPEIVDNSTEDETDWLIVCESCGMAVLGSNDAMPMTLQELVDRWNTRKKRNPNAYPPEKPRLVERIYPKLYRCPVCDYPVIYRETYMYNQAFGDLQRAVKMDFCKNCGQAIDWTK